MKGWAEGQPINLQGLGSDDTSRWLRVLLLNILLLGACVLVIFLTVVAGLWLLEMVPPHTWGGC